MTGSKKENTSEAIKEIKAEDSKVKNEIVDQISSFTDNATEIPDSPENVSGSDNTEPKKKVRKKKKNPEDEIKEMITGEVLIMFIDLIFPNLVCGANNLISKTKVDASKVMLTQKQRESLESSANIAADYLALKVHPLWIFFGSLITIYTMNMITQKATEKARLKMQSNGKN